MRLTAPELAARYRDGMVAEGAHVLDAGQVGTEMLYFLVGSRELDGGLMCTASHNPKAYTGAKLVERGAIALSGDAGIGEIRGSSSRPASADGPRRRLLPRRSTSATEFRAAALAFIDPGAVKPLQVVVDGGNGMAGPMVGPLLERLGLDLVTTYWEPDGELPRPRAQPAAAGEPPASSSTRCSRRAPTSASPGTATPTAASSSTTPARFVDGDFLTALLAESLLASSPGADILYDVRASRAVADTVGAAGGTRARQPRRPRVLQDAACATRAACSAARSPATTTSATSTTRTRGRSRRC